jgi:hypothetical protein
MPVVRRVVASVFESLSGLFRGSELGGVENPAILIRRLRDRHWTMLWLSIFVIAASFALEVRDSQTVGPIGFPSVSLPETCGCRMLFGIECPGCGLTRSFIALASGDMAESIRFHRLGWFLALAIALQIPYRLFSLWEIRTRIPRRSWPTWYGNVIILMLISNWLLKVTHLY